MQNDKFYNFTQVEHALLENEKLIINNKYDETKESYSIVLPPPNVTGQLHIGHFLGSSLQDIILRHQSMMGKNVKWFMGLDHAGIATQMLVERQLSAEGIKKEDIGRDKFIEKVYEWKDEYGGKILHQLRKLGIMTTLNNVPFTMESNSSDAVLDIFVQLYEDGLITKKKSLINWDTKLQTAISDLEVVNKEVSSKFYYMYYKLVNSKESLIVGTTRPETIFGDTALAVNPQDERYKKYIGKKAYVPLINREIPIVADEYADKEKGSGVVKITPAHDFNDYDVYARHNIEIINIMNKDGKLNNNVPKAYESLDVKEARKKVLEDLKIDNLFDREENIKTTVPYGDKSGSIVEPYLTEQWFLDVADMAKDAIDLVETNKIKFVDESWKNLYNEWMKNIHPWCISRQLWWGHRIPVFYNVNDSNHIFVAKNMNEAIEKAKKYYIKNNQSNKIDAIKLIQDESVLDTWFSSALWPYVSMGFPANDENMKKYFPSDILVTAFDIIFFWVARMIMMTKYKIGDIPFKQIYLTGLIKDAKGQKMSKTKGNVIDPLGLSEKYGTDAVRFTLAMYSHNKQGFRLDEKNIENYRNFVTKIWNSYKLCKIYDMTYDETFNINNVQNDINKWILYKFINVKNEIILSYNEYNFFKAGSLIYDFTWKLFCDYYLEIIKVVVKDKQTKEFQNVMAFIFAELLKLLNPIMPFISTYLYEDLTGKNINKNTTYGNNNVEYDIKYINKAGSIIDLMSYIRHLRGVVNIPYSKKLNIFFDGNMEHVLEYKDVLSKILKLNNIDIYNKNIANKNIIVDVFDGSNIYVEISDDFDLTAEMERLKRKYVKLEGELAKINSILSQKKFIEKAQASVIAQKKQERNNLLEQIDKLKSIVSKISI